jgi:glyoxylase-like metal-dependent hydrolase (beta-lactamase superfamily II)
MEGRRLPEGHGGSRRRACFLRRYEPDQVRRVCGLVATLSAHTRSPEAVFSWSDRSTRPRISHQRDSTVFPIHITSSSRIAEPSGSLWSSLTCDDDAMTAEGRPTERSGPWIEVGDRVFTRRYRVYDQQIGVVLGKGEALVIDTRVSHRLGQEILDDLRELTADPVTLVVDTHWHWDHTFGNHVFRPATIWGHERCGPRLLEHADRMRNALNEQSPEHSDEIDEIVVDPPDRAFTETARVLVGGRAVWLRYLGRGHTDADIVVEVPDAGTLFAGDLLEEGATPYFGDGYPLDWPETVSRLSDLVRGPVVPGHGAVGDRAFVESQLAGFLEIARLGREVHAGRLPLDEAIAASPFDPKTSREPLERSLAQLRGELD